MTRTPRSRVGEPVGDADLMTLRTDVGPAPFNIGAALVLGPGARSTDVARLVADRLGGVPRLRQVLVDGGRGRGRPAWTEDPDLDVTSHVSTVECTGASGNPEGIDAVLALAADALSTPLPPTRPLWRALVVTTPEDDTVVAVVVVMHHVVADGLGGLQLLDRLVDGSSSHERTTGGANGSGSGSGGGSDGRSHGIRGGSGSPRENLRDRRRQPRFASRARRGWRELGPPRGVTAPRTSLNRPTGPHRTLRVVTVPLEPLRTTARGHGATVNDVLLVAVTGAMGRLLRLRGESASHLVVSVPVSGRGAGDTGLGNRVGVMPVRVPLAGDAAHRLHDVAAATRTHRARVRGDSAALLVPVFRALAAVGAFRWFVEHQRMVTSFLSNMRGPVTPVHLAGAPVRGLVPLTTTSGNIGVSFAALSYAGRLAVTLTADPDVVPEVEALAEYLASELAGLSDLAGPAEHSTSVHPKLRGTNGPVAKARPAARSIHGPLPD